MPEFHALGQRLFRDAEPLGDRPALHFDFYTRDILHDSSAAEWAPLERRFDILTINSFLHTWNREGQIKAATRMVSFLKHKLGSLIVCNSLASREAGEFTNLEGTGTNYRQNEESWVRFWEEVGEKIGTKWSVKSTFTSVDVTKDNKRQKWAGPGIGLLIFENVMV